MSKYQNAIQYTDLGIPNRAPSGIVIDPGQNLTASDRSDINGMADKLVLRPKVVILPQSFKGDKQDMLQVGRQIAIDWRVSQDKLLVVIDPVGRHVRLYAGNGLRARGLNANVIDGQLLPDSFYPYMREGDLHMGIKNLLSATSDYVASRSYQSIVGSRSNTYTNGAQSAANHGGSTLGFFAVLSVVALLIVAILIGNNKKRKRVLEQNSTNLAQDLDVLYQKADQLGQAAEYMDAAANKELASRLSGFFVKVSTLIKAQDEVNTLKHNKKIDEAIRGVSGCIKLARELNQEADQLLPQVNAITGGVESYASMPAKKEWEQKKERDSDMDNQDKFYRPAWSRQPEYQPPMIVNSPGGGLFDVLYLVNQMEMSHQLSMINQRMDHASGGGFFESGGDWGSSNASSSEGFFESGGDWGDSGGGDFDGGGDSGGGDW